MRIEESWITLDRTKPETKIVKIYKRMKNRAKCYTTFYGRNLRMFISGRVLVPGKTFQPGPMFVGHCGRPWSGAPQRCSNYLGSSLTCKHCTKMERLASHKHSRCIFVNHRCKKSYNIGPRCKSYETFLSSLTVFQNKLGCMCLENTFSLIFAWKAKRPRTYN